MIKTFWKSVLYPTAEVLELRVMTAPIPKDAEKTTMDFIHTLFQRGIVMNLAKIESGELTLIGPAETILAAISYSRSLSLVPDPRPAAIKPHGAVSSRYV